VPVRFIRRRRDIFRHRARRRNPGPQR
jgi:hypothetical protein